MDKALARERVGEKAQNVGIGSCVLCGWQLCIDKHDGDNPTVSRWVGMLSPRVERLLTREELETRALCDTSDRSRTQKCDRSDVK
jgi:hypothetical protein